MSLIKCPDCHREISNRAVQCPFCGCPAQFFNTTDEKAITTIETKIKGDDETASSSPQASARSTDVQVASVRVDEKNIETPSPSQGEHKPERISAQKNPPSDEITLDDKKSQLGGYYDVFIKFLLIVAIIDSIIGVVGVMSSEYVALYSSAENKGFSIILYSTVLHGLFYIAYCSITLYGLGKYYKGVPYFYTMTFIILVVSSAALLFVSLKAHTDPTEYYMRGGLSLLWLVINIFYFRKKMDIFVEENKPYFRWSIISLCGALLSIVLIFWGNMLIIDQSSMTNTATNEVSDPAESGSNGYTEKEYIENALDHPYRLYDINGSTYTSEALQIKYKMPKSLDRYREAQISEKNGIKYSTLEEYRVAFAENVQNHQNQMEFYAADRDGLNNLAVSLYYPSDKRELDLSTITKEALFTEAYINSLKEKTGAESVMVSESDTEFCGYKAKRFFVSMKLDESRYAYETEIVFATEHYIGYVVMFNYLDDKSEEYLAGFSPY